MVSPTVPAVPSASAEMQNVVSTTIASSSNDLRHTGTFSSMLSAAVISGRPIDSPAEGSPATESAADELESDSSQDSPNTAASPGETIPDASVSSTAIAMAVAVPNTPILYNPVDVAAVPTSRAAVSSAPAVTSRDSAAQTVMQEGSGVENRIDLTETVQSVDATASVTPAVAESGGLNAQALQNQLVVQAAQPVSKKPGFAVPTVPMPANSDGDTPPTDAPVKIVNNMPAAPVRQGANPRTVATSGSGPSGESIPNTTLPTQQAVSGSVADSTNVRPNLETPVENQAVDLTQRLPVDSNGQAGAPVQAKPPLDTKVKDARSDVLLDMRHTDSNALTRSSTTSQAVASASDPFSASAGLQSSSQAAIPVAAITQDNQQTANRNIASERSTTTSLGGVLAGPSETGTDAEANLAEHGGSRNEERRSSERTAGPRPKPEQTSAATRASPAESPLKAAPAESVPPLSAHERVRVVDQVAQKLDTMRISNGRQEVTVHLRPDHLGDLRLTIVADRQEVTARIVAETAAARDAVQEGLEQLRSALEHKGYSLQGLDVSLGGAGQQRMPLFQQEPARVPGSPANMRAQQEVQSATSADLGARTMAALSAGRIDYQA